MSDPQGTRQKSVEGFRFTKNDKKLTRTIRLDRVVGRSILKDQDLFEKDDFARSLAWDKGYLLGEVRYGIQGQQLPLSPEEVRIADIFCGAGALSRGVYDAVQSVGLKPKTTLALDQEHAAIEVYRKNFGLDHAVIDDVWSALNFDVTDLGPTPNLEEFDDRLKTWFDEAPTLRDEIADAKGKVDILIGGPPCEGHSNFNNKTRRADLRNLLYLVMPMMAHALKAKVVVIENVPTVTSDKFEALKKAKVLFEGLGYRITDQSEAVLRAHDLGLAQTRRRHILIATRKENSQVELGRFNNELQRTRKKETRTLEWAIKDLMYLDGEDDSEKKLIDIKANLTDRNKERIAWLQEQDEYILPNHLRPPKHQVREEKPEGHTYPSVYGRMYWEKASGTITTGFSSPGRGRFVHPEQPRTITPHEAARIQGFPDTFLWERADKEHLPRGSIVTMIGDAVPPAIGFVAGLAALDSIKDQLEAP